MVFELLHDEKAWKELDKLNSELLEMRKHRNEFSPEGYNKRDNAIREKIRTAKEAIFEVPRAFDTDIRMIRNELVKDFSDKYSATPEKVDSNGLVLLQSGLLTDSELERLALKYSDNATMLRFVGQAIEKRGNETGNTKLRAHGAALLRESIKQPHTDIYDNFAEFCTKGIRSGEDTGDIEGARSMSEGYHTQLHAEMYAKYSEMGEAINSD